MIYRLIILSSAERDIRKLPREIQARVTVRIEALKTNPRPHDVKKLEASDEYRIRVGDYRVVYTIDDDIVTITIVRVGHRREVYR
ncbi:MAG: type II toxin-antitoxin system RelE/ParE family toxin [Chloroflexi bacterium]|nr:type II toxin-antitoxin system RelE/ParE family toxin [Chloroflexota bacterium]